MGFWILCIGNFSMVLDTEGNKSLTRGYELSIASLFHAMEYVIWKMYTLKSFVWEWKLDWDWFLGGAYLFGKISCAYKKIVYAI